MHEDTGGMKKLGSFAPSAAQLKDKFKVMMPQVSLFGNDWSALKKSCCPLCGCRLKVHRSLAVSCTSKRHLKPFYMSQEKMEQVLKEL